MVAVEVADLPTSELEGKLATPAVAGPDAWPGSDLLGDLLARCSLLGQKWLLEGAFKYIDLQVF
jgi:hypothetical protein